MGQAKKLRPCPAAGRDIAAAECGENRHSRYACPAGCPFNPFSPANYTALLEDEARLDLASVARLDRDTPGGVWAALDSARRRNPGHGLHAATVWRLFFERDTVGRTFAERWAQAGFRELKNDARVFFRAKMRTRVVLLEVHRVLDAAQIEAVDLLDPAAPPRLIVDRAIAAGAKRFSVFLTWIYPLPHFWRLSGTGIVLPGIGDCAPEEIVVACIVHLGGPAVAGEARDRWLAENFTRIDATLTATANERRRQMFAAMDAQFGTATYELRAPLAVCRAALVADPAVAEDDLSDRERGEGFVEAMAWFEDPAAGSAATLPGRRVGGRVLLAPDRVRVEAMGAVRLDALRAQFEARLGDRVGFSKERRDDLGSRLATAEPPADLALVPPRLLEQPTRLDLASSRVPAPLPGVSVADYQADLMHQQRLALMDTPLPALDGLTPRAAAGDLLLRPRLIALMKSHVRQLDEQNLRSGRSDDINGILRELGLVEIDFPPPPPRAIPPDGDDLADEEGDGGEDFGEALPASALARSVAPPLTGPPLSMEQALERLDAALAFATAQDALDELDESGATLLDDLSDLTVEWLNEEEYAFFVTFLIQAWFALVPLGRRAPSLRHEAMDAALASEMAQVWAGESLAVETIGRFIRGCRQPALMEALISGLMHAAQTAPKKLRPSPVAVVAMVVALRVVLDELDLALRRR